MSKRMYSTANLTDIQLKEQGNQMFLARKYDDAINLYTKAIIKNPNNATCFTNRALCHLKLKHWDMSCMDCRRALDIDGNLLKAHFFLGQSLMEQEHYDEAIKHLQRAFDLSKEQKLKFGDDITSQLRLARKKRWNVLEEKRICQEIELQTYINKLIKDDMENRLAKLKIDDTTSEDQLKEKQQEIEQECDDHIKELNNVFAKVDDRRRKRDVPDFLCGKISFEILTDPVITPSGITYERKDIEEHLQRVGHFDPVTRVKLTQDQLIPNFSMKEVVDGFIADNEWALHY
ncbi:E3 ubiquitin-protein ligase CHIP [Teleopsis dalmanni]|uniref:E3 ubiquitin-protein ligase CHIP n=1 Tax=Teleopsis dalmanni TaxID=139649 RepID=UPI0018CDB459|nr:E3 ubiquitin-protein ligase CHIP [Teleopsis dalmanni]XP_037960739.1 E3 ubiquitin-protein ligase CHIP [Teleopsis dalmanni]